MTTEASASKPDVAVIDYGMGNLRSVLRAWQAVGGDARLVTTPSAIADADALVFPGQGAIVDTMRLLVETGFDGAIREWIAEDRPFFGICLGLQALFEHSEEGDTATLGIFGGRVRRFPSGEGLRIPHMGWNAARFSDPSNALASGLDPAGEQFYFVHSYFVDADDRSLVLCETDYGGPFVSGIERGNCCAVQFHPEKSQAKGLQIYRNFLGSKVLSAGS